MNSLPLISIAVPSFNQAQFIRETLQSLVDQNYPNLEVIIQDGGSTDGAVDIAREFVSQYPAIFQLFVEKDRGHAQAVNRAFRRTRGEILGYLNTDDTLYPGCLHRVAQEIDPARNRYIVFGRCLFTGAGSVYVGTEHPAEFTNHFEFLAIWKRGYNTIPQPATFWHRRVYERCGDFDEKHNHGLDYLQWCRFSRKFQFHKVDALWATYRMHPASVSSNKTEQDWLNIMVQYSRMYWGPWWKPLRWRCEISYWIHGQHLHEKARHHARRAEEHWQAKRFVPAIGEALLTTRYSPKMTWHRLVTPLLLDGGASGLGWLLFCKSAIREQEFTGKYPDNWIGPCYRQELLIGTETQRLVLILQHVPQDNGKHAKIEMRLSLNGQQQAIQTVETAKQFHFSVDATAYRGMTVNLELRTPQFFIPRYLTGTADDRQLSALLLEVRQEPKQQPK